MGRYLNQLFLSEKQTVLHVCICCWGKEKNILNEFNVCKIGKISHSLTDIGHQIFPLKKFNFSILYSRQCSLLA